MKAIIKKEAKPGLIMTEVPKPKPLENEILIKIRKTSICGTDVHLYEWDEWARKTLPVPSIVGHEFAGVVAEVGSMVKGFSVGERVSGEGHLTCGSCRYCLNGERVLCPKTKGVGVNRDGCFAEYLCLPAENVFKIPEGISDEMASIFDPFGNAVHTLFSFNPIGQDVLITGAGPIGLMTIPLALRAGARNVVITDLTPARLEIAKKMGATAAVNIRERELTEVMKELNIEGFDICCEMSGSGAAFASLPALAAPGGKLVLLGILPQNVALDWHLVIFKMLTIKGIYGREIFRTWDLASRLLQSGLDLSPVITHRLKAEEFDKGFAAMISGQSGKVILDWT